MISRLFLSLLFLFLAHSCSDSSKESESFQGSNTQNQNTPLKPRNRILTNSNFFPTTNCPSLNASVGQNFTCHQTITATETIWFFGPTHTCNWIEITPHLGLVEGTPQLSNIGTCTLHLQVISPDPIVDEIIFTITVSSGPDAITDLDVGISGINEIELSWTAPDDNGTAITDYIIEYRTNPSGTWTVFNDGVSTDEFTTVTGLIEDTIYDFRVRAFNTAESPDSNLATGSTLINHPFFIGLKAFNLGGATDNQVVALFDNTEVRLNGAVIANLNQGDTHRFSAALNDILEADKEFYVAGESSNGAMNMVWNVRDWAGKNFLFDTVRNTPITVNVRAFEDTTIEIYRDGSLFTSQFVTANSNHAFSISPSDLFEMNSTGFITAYTFTGSSGDSYPLLPTRNDILGVPSGSAYFQVADVDTNANLYFSSSNGPSFDIFEFDAINNVTGTGSQYSGASLRVISDEPVSAHSLADSDGLQSSPFVPRSFLKSNFAVNHISEWVKFVSNKPSVVTRINPGGATSSFTLSRTGSDPNAPYDARLTNVAEGTVFLGSEKMQVWYEPNTNTAAAIEDETIIFGW